MAKATHPTRELLTPSAMLRHIDLISYVLAANGRSASLSGLLEG